jgi:intracellular multiplication protein IcmD
VTVTLCDPSLNPVGTITVAPDANGNPQGQVVAGGTCTFANPFALALALPGLAGGPGAGIPTNLSSLPNLAQLITAGSYVAGLGFGIAAIAKFKAHKDNPTQSPVSSGIALLFISAALLFIPSIYTATGKTLFGNESSVLGVAGVAAFATPP